MGFWDVVGWLLVVINVALILGFVLLVLGFGHDWISR